MPGLIVRVMCHVDLETGSQDEKSQKSKVVENRIPNKSCFQPHFQIPRPIPDHSLRHPYRSDIMFRPRADRHVRFDSQGDVSRGYGNWIAG